MRLNAAVCLLAFATSSCDDPASSKPVAPSATTPARVTPQIEFSWGFRTSLCLFVQPRLDTEAYRHDILSGNGALSMTDWDHHLEKTSRTFALAIPLLEEPIRREVTLSYLLFRVADTLEDAATWPASMRSTSLRAFAETVRNADLAQAIQAATHWLELGPTEHEGYLALLEAYPALLHDARAVKPKAAERILHHLLRTIDLMDQFVLRSNDNDQVVLHTRQDLQDYCYAVAGIVGELLTDLFLLQTPQLRDVSDVLQAHAAAFGEGLQLVNIVRDALDDAREGRAFLPDCMSVDEVFELADADLDRASLYVETLRRNGASEGTVAFVALPVALARATLQRVRAQGAGAKLSRAEVAEVMARVQALSTGTA